MEILVVLIVLGGIGLSILFGYLRSQANKALSRHVLQRGEHARGQQLTNEVIEFTVPVAPDVLIGTVVARLGLPAEAPGAFLGKLYIERVQADAVVFAFGNKLSQSFRSALTAESRGAGCVGSYTVINWTEGDGIVAGLSEMEILANTVRLIAGELGGTLGASATPVPVAPAAPIVAVAPAGPTFCTQCGSAELGDRFCTDCGAPIAA